MDNYRKLLLFDTPKACDRNGDQQQIRERHLHAIWAEQKWISCLKTSLNEPIEVISSGIWNTGPGPDFLQAEIRIGEVLLKGDIEIHFQDASWNHHGHHTNSAYNNVILHVSLDGNRVSLNKENGEFFHQCYLEECLTAPLSDLAVLIDLDSYPYKEFLGSGDCAKSLFHNLDRNKIENFFHEAALWRLHKKYELLNFSISDAADFLIAGICQGLGFRHNSAQFLQLYRAVEHRGIENEKALLAYLMGLCGFFVQRYQQLWGEDPYFQQLFSLAPATPQAVKLHLSQVRPLNHPLRRLVYLSKFLIDPNRYKIQRELMSMWEQFEEPKQFLKGMLKLIPDYTDPYFDHHMLFGGKSTAKKYGLLGEGTKQEIVVNSFVPFLYETMTGASDREKISLLLKELPSKETGKLKYLSHRFFGQTSENKVLSRGDLQQGSYQLHRDFCQHYESSCVGCPFVKKYKSIF